MSESDLLKKKLSQLFRLNQKILTKMLSKPNRFEMN